jgi:hypothetical protein
MMRLLCDYGSGSGSSKKMIGFLADLVLFKTFHHSRNDVNTRFSLQFRFRLKRENDTAPCCPGFATLFSPYIIYNFDVEIKKKSFLFLE